MPRCDCVSCRILTDLTALPVPVVVNFAYPHSHRFWAWLTRLEGGCVEFHATDRDERGWLCSRKLTSARDLVRFFASTIGVDLSEHDLSDRAANLFAYLDTGHARSAINLRDLVHRVRGEAPVPQDIGDSCRCARLELKTRFSMAKLKATRKRARADPVPAPTADRGDPERDTGDPDPTRAYDPKQLERFPGMEGRVRELVHLRERWNESIVLELIEAGALVPLHEAHEVHDDGKCERVRCTFLDYQGRLVPNVWLPLGFLQQMYPARVAHL